LDRNRLVVSLSDDSQEFQRSQATEARRIGRELGIEIEVLFAANSARLQDQQLTEVLARHDATHPAAILAHPISDQGLVSRARESARKGIGWILLNRRAPYVDELRREHPELPIAAISPDQMEIGRLQGRQLLSRFQTPTVRVLYVQGRGDTSAAIDRLDGTRAVLEASAMNAALELVQGEWTELSGERVTARWLADRRSLWQRVLRRPTWLPDALLCQNDHMAVGARRAALAVGLNVPVFGVDGLPEGGQRLVDAGELAATVIVLPNTGTAIHLVERQLRGGSPLPADVLLSPVSYPKLPARAKRGRQATSS